MTVFLFPDNTVLCNFAAIDRLDVLERASRGRARWTAAVAYEAEQSSRHLPALRTTDMRSWLGEPIEITDGAEIIHVARIRRVVFGGTDTKPLQHLGEAETCCLIKERQEFADSIWISDDQDTVRYAKFQHIHVWETIDLMRHIVADGDLTDAQAFELMQQMADTGRALRIPAKHADLR